jgi:streptogramin lyase
VPGAEPPRPCQAVALFAQLFFSSFRPPVGRTSLLSLPAVHTGHFTEYTLPSLTSDPSGIAVGRDGNLWFVEYDSNALGRITPQGTITEYELPHPGSSPDGITTGPDHSLWFTENNGNRIGRYSL